MSGTENRPDQLSKNQDDNGNTNAVETKDDSGVNEENDVSKQEQPSDPLTEEQKQQNMTQPDEATTQTKYLNKFCSQPPSNASVAPPEPSNQDSMRVVQLTTPIDPWNLSPEAAAAAFQLTDLPIPKPRSGEVLIRVLRAAVNPSDLSTLSGTYGDSRQKEASALPFTPGFEGCGVVISNNAGLVGWRLLGKRVAFAMRGRPGSWAPYVSVPAVQCMPLPPDVPHDAGAYAFVNPLTALAFFEIVAQRRVSAFVHTAAASALGRMVIRLGRHKGIRVLNVVRRPEQVRVCLEEGAAEEDCFVSESPEFPANLRNRAREVGASVCFDAVGGPLTGTLLGALPSKSTLFVYGGLARAPVGGIAVSNLIFEGKTVTGFWLTDYLKSKWIVGLLKWQRELQTLLPNVLKTEVRATYPASRAGEAVAAYCRAMTAGKVCIGPNLPPDTSPLGAGESHSSDTS